MTLYTAWPIVLNNNKLNIRIGNMFSLGKYRIIFLNALTVCILAGCSAQNNLSSEVKIKNSEVTKSNTVLTTDFNPEEIECIAVRNIIDNSESKDFSNLSKSTLVRQAAYGALSSKNYRDIELTRIDNFSEKSNSEILQILDCDAVMEGEITQFKNDYLVAFSSTKVEITLFLKDKDNQLIWKAHHLANSSDGNVPLSPISLLTGIYSAVQNNSEEVAMQMIDLAIRKTIEKLPNRSVLIYDDSEISDIVNNISASDADSSSQQAKSQEKPISLLSKGAYEEALILAETALEKNPLDKENLLVAARASLLLRNPQNAADYSLRLLVLDGNDADALSIAGVAYLNLKDFKLAEGAFKKNIQNKDVRSSDYYNLGIVLIAQGKYVEGSDRIFEAGNLAIKNKENKKIYRSFKKLKELSDADPYANRLYKELGKSVDVYLSSLD